MNDHFSADKACRNAGMPLGGIGAGSFEIRPDGYCYNWYLMNNQPWGAGAETELMEREGLRFGIQVRGEATGLRAFTTTKHYGLDPVPDGWFWNTDPYHIPWVQHPEHIEFDARIPFAELTFAYEDAPISLSLQAWSPLVPGSVTDSNTPGAVLSFQIRNETNEALEVNFYGLLKNVAGYDHPEHPSRMEFLAEEQLLKVWRSGLDADGSSNGQMCLAVDNSCDNASTSYVLHPRHGRDLWDILRDNGRLECSDYGKDTISIGEVGAEVTVQGATGQHRRGAISSDFRLQPGETAEVTFTVSWFFPNLWEIEKKDVVPSNIGHFYSNRFTGAESVIGFLRANRERLATESRAFLDAFYETSLPGWMLDAINAQFSPLLRTAWLDKQGRFGQWEGMGRCGLQTVDVSHYANFFAIQLWPELDVSQQLLVMANCNSVGKVPHTMHGVFDAGELNCDKRIDLCSQFILAIWRYTLWSGSTALALEAWPHMLRQLEILQEKDTDGDGLPNAVGKDQTYDKFRITGSSILINSGYVAALNAMHMLSERLGKDSDSIRAFQTQATQALATTEEQLWNGKYYDLSMDPVTGEKNTGCLVDQLNGDWFYQQASGKSIFPQQRKLSAMDEILRHTVRRAGPESWLANCSWPDGGEIAFDRNGSDQVNSPWSGVEYAFAAYLILNGKQAQGRQVMESVYRRYDRAGMRFNHYECGEYYHRAMSAFAIYNAEFGITYNGFDRVLSVRRLDHDARFLVALPGGYGQVSYSAADHSASLRIVRGDVPRIRVEVMG